MARVLETTTEPKSVYKISGRKMGGGMMMTNPAFCRGEHNVADKPGVMHICALLPMRASR